jgi:hypothetical protein
MNTSYKVDDYITWSTSDNFTASGIILQIISKESILVDTGKGGGRGLEYITPKQILADRT